MMKNKLFSNQTNSFWINYNSLNWVKFGIVFLLIFNSAFIKAQTANGRFFSFDFSPVTATQFNTVTTYKSYFGNTTYIDTAGILISRGAGTALSQTAGSYGFSGVNAGSEATAITNNEYVEFQVKPKAGNEVRLDSIIMRWQFSTASIAIIHSVRSSTNGYASTLGTTTTTASGTANANNITKIVLTEPLYEKDTFTLRIYIAGPSGGGTNGRIYRFTDGTSSTSFNHDISLWGRVSVTQPFMQAFDFSTSLGSEATRPTYNANTTFIDTAGITISSGAGFSAPTTLAGSYGVAGINTANQGNAITANDYVEFTLNPKPGYEYALDHIMFRYRQTTTGTGYALRSSQNNYASNIASGTLVQTANTNGIEYITLLTAGSTAVSPLSSDSSITFRLYFWGTTTARSLYFTDGTSTSTLNNDIAFYGTMTTATIPQATLSAVGSTSTCLGGGISLKVATLGGTAPFTVFLKDNLGTQRTHVQYGADTTFTIFPQTDRTYTLDSVLDVMNHKASSSTGTVNVTVTASPVITSVGTIARTLNHLDGYTLTYANGDSCKSWVRITDSIGGTNPGSTNCLAEVLAATPMNNTARAYVARRVNITPTTNGVARVTLFYSQAEFTAFNSVVTYQQKLPISESDTVGIKSKFLIRRTSSSLETASTASFTPDSVSWNSATSAWEVNFRVNDGILGGNYYLSPNFTSSKLVTGLTHTAATPVSGQISANVTVDWDDVPGVTQYRLRIRPQGGTWNASTITGSQRIMNLAFNTTYEVQARVYESQQVQGEYTTTYTFTTPVEGNKLPDCLTPPTSVTVNNPSSVTISWPSAVNATSYIVQVRPKNSLVWGGSSTSGNSITFNSLSSNTVYEYRIRTTCTPGYTSNGTSSFSAVDSFTTTPLANCGTINNLTVNNVGINNATIRWSPTLYASAYQVEMRLKNTAVWGGTTTVDTSFTFNNLSANSQYEYRVRTFCNNPLLTNTTSGTFSAIGEFTTNAQTLTTCLPPTNIQTTPTANSVGITWNTALNGMQYFVNLKTQNAGSWGGTTVSTNNITFSSLSPSTNYQVRIRTVCTPGTTFSANSVFSDTVLFVTTSLANKFDIGTGAESIRVYPNPIRDWLHIDYTSQTEDPVVVYVRDMSGRVINTIQVAPMIGENPIEIDFRNAANGLYVVQIVQSGTLKFTSKITK
ncbi:MAG: fibronectin type III domain-containing protein [Chitinophagaceae bacterium]